ncbi:copper homeostasis protein CutC [Sphingobium sp.]|uniref:copper homeostasis protein CutC n=1 Tax=Sphingobium sp. TaxID=1912891 RepID=UPI0035C6FBCC
MSRILLEICVESMPDLESAIRGGADRIELCGALALGGLTPSAGLARLAVERLRAGGKTVRAMVRPRDGDFVYDAAMLDTAVAEGAALIDAGVDGLVFGAVRNGGLDADALRGWVTAMRKRRGNIGLTLHRAIDLADDPLASVDLAVELGFDHILTSGGAVKALDALPVLAAMHRRAGGRIVIMPGSGIRAANVRQLIAATDVQAVHASASMEGYAPDPRALTMGFALGAARRTSLAEVQALRAALDA